MENTPKRSLFESASPKLTFWFGFFVGAGLLTLIGFVFLLVMMVQGIDLGSSKSTTKTSATPPANTNTVTPPSKVDAADITIGDDDYVRGNPDAAVTVVEFTDLECPFCKKFHPSIKNVFEANGDNVRWVFKHFPLSFHPEAKPAAVAAECAGKLGGNDTFWKYVDTLYDNQNDLGDGLYKQMAADLGLKAGDFATCLESDEFDAKIAADQKLGQSIGVGGTPSSFVIAGGTAEKLNGAVPQTEVEAAVADALAR